MIKNILEDTFLSIGEMLVPQSGGEVNKIENPSVYSGTNMQHIWETEDHRNEWRENSKDLLANAIANCIELDKKAGREPSLD